MLELLPSIGSAFVLGLWTSLTPCPLATNIAALSYLAKRIDHPRAVLLSSGLYTCGRALAYAALGILLATSLLAAEEISRFFSRHFPRLLGPILILIGMVLCDLLRFNFSRSGASQRLAKRAERWGLCGALALGAIFALSFCPVSAAIFFGALMTLALKAGSGILVPCAFGVGTALPVALFASLLACGARWVGTVYHRIATVEKWVRTAAGVVFIAVGIYLCLAYIYKVL